ncbi:type II secretion system protein [bacterium]|nr:type II secretion system protein [bacterium]
MAFTLAETLIVMGIIGVVAALTLPNLNSSTGDKEKVAKVKKIYSNLSDAVGRATAVYGPTDEWCTGLTYDACNKRSFERVTEFMKFSKQCTVSDNCSFEFGANNKFSNGISSRYGVILADGAFVNIEIFVHGFIDFKIDIDGPNKGAGKNCIDFFTFYAYPKSGVRLSNNLIDDVPNMNLANGDSSAVCAGWIIQHDNMDYLKIDSSGKCPDGKTILNPTSNTTCK